MDCWFGDVTALRVDSMVSLHELLSSLLCLSRSSCRGLALCLPLSSCCSIFRFGGGGEDDGSAGSSTTSGTGLLPTRPCLKLDDPLTVLCRCMSCCILVKLSDRGGGPGGGGGTPLAPRVWLSPRSAEGGIGALSDALLLAAGGGPGGGGGTPVPLDDRICGGADGFRCAFGGIGLCDTSSGNDVCWSPLGVYSPCPCPDGGEYPLLRVGGCQLWGASFGVSGVVAAVEPPPVYPLELC